MLTLLALAGAPLPCSRDFMVKNDTSCASAGATSLNVKDANECCFLIREKNLQGANITQWSYRSGKCFVMQAQQAGAMTPEAGAQCGTIETPLQVCGNSMKGGMHTDTSCAGSRSRQAVAATAADCCSKCASDTFMCGSWSFDGATCLLNNHTNEPLTPAAGATCGLKYAAPAVPSWLDRAKFRTANDTRVLMRHTKDNFAQTHNCTYPGDAFGRGCSDIPASAAWQTAPAPRNTTSHAITCGACWYGRSYEMSEAYFCADDPAAGLALQVVQYSDNYCQQVADRSRQPPEEELPTKTAAWCDDDYRCAPTQPHRWEYDTTKCGAQCDLATCGGGCCSRLPAPLTCMSIPRCGACPDYDTCTGGCCEKVDPPRLCQTDYSCADCEEGHRECCTDRVVDEMVHGTTLVAFSLVA
jgi:hypothetical protein